MTIASQSSRVVALLACLGGAAALAGESDRLSIAEQSGRLEIRIGEEDFAAYVYRDERILRPYFTNVKAPGGVQVTRHHPPVEGRDSTDHDTMHPGIALGFGDLDGHDFWRNKAAIEHVGFVERPAIRDDGRRLTFAVRLRYRAGETTVCHEIRRHTLLVRPGGYLLSYDSEFRAGDRAFAFGDQEEMGLGVRLNDALRVAGGNGRILDSQGRTNEPQVWGKTAEWCDYSGTIDGRRAGLLVMPHPDNFRRCWFHARDYGFLAANPFGRNAFTGGEKSRIEVRPGATFRLRYGVLVYSAPPDEPLDHAAVFREYVDVE
ncbi:MAG TPA: DUF6807 family protein [Planctomycetaceae bacterium]|nr:DUF6807 family protein [Planctomycetaceae bacterium]